jgi:Tfp pilus assembly protein PilN
VKALNLAERPFRNQRLAAAAFAASTVVVLGVTVWHAVVVRNLLPARTTERHQEVAALEAEFSRLDAEERVLLKMETPPAATLAEWNLVKEIVDRRAFSWTGLFARLEQVIPEGVRLRSVSPSVSKGEVQLDVEATVRSREAGWDFVRALDDGGDFYGVYPKRETADEFSYVVRYRPRKPAPPIGAPTPSPAGEAAAASPAPEAAAVRSPLPVAEARR